MFTFFTMHDTAILTIDKDSIQAVKKNSENTYLYLY